LITAACGLNPLGEGSFLRTGWQPQATASNQNVGIFHAIIATLSSHAKV
jgi:hypothetical protein